MKIYQVVELDSGYIDGWGGDWEWEEEINKGYYSTKEKAEEKLEKLTKKHWNDEENHCMEQYKIKEIELDVEEDENEF